MCREFSKPGTVTTQQLGSRRDVLAADHDDRARQKSASITIPSHNIVAATEKCNMIRVSGQRAERLSASTAPVRTVAEKSQGDGRR